MYDNILVPLDGSRLAEQALEHATALAKGHGATVHLLHVLTQHPGGAAPIGGGLEADHSRERTAELARQLEEARLTHAQEYLDHTAERLQREGLKTATWVSQGPPDQEIVEYVRRNDIDLVVMSTHGHGGIRRLLTGSVTERVVRSGEAPVLVVPPREG